MLEPESLFRKDAPLRSPETAPGILEATGGGGWNAGAGIGADGRSNQSVGTIIIRGGTVKATGNNSYSYGSVSAASAGIGGTTESKSGTIQITGGTVTAVGGMYAAGIGGGSNGRTEKIEISGGTITVIGGSQYSYSGAAIGPATIPGMHRLAEKNFPAVKPYHKRNYSRRRKHWIRHEA